jgi:2-polyprenyl-6-methoxyphenol hydroxylase-like FAD-dependent oxidoreductase
VLDPLTGQGIGDAFRDAELLAEALLGSASLSTYAKRRDAAALPMYELTLQLASFAAMSGPQLAVMRALKSDQAQTDRFFGVITGSVPIAEFFSPMNLSRLLARSVAARLMLAVSRRAAPSSATER